MTIQRNGNKFYKGNVDLCEMLEYRKSDTFARIKMDGEQVMCPIKPVIELVFPTEIKFIQIIFNEKLQF